MVLLVALSGCAEEAQNGEGDAQSGEDTGAQEEENQHGEKGLLDYSDEELAEIMETDKDLVSFMAEHNYEILNKEILDSERLKELQEQEGPYGEWYQRLETGKEYLQFDVQFEDSVNFTAVLSPQESKVEQIVANITLEMG